VAILQLIQVQTQEVQAQLTQPSMEQHSNVWVVAQDLVMDITVSKTVLSAAVVKAAQA
jgi:hypothetical protein